MRPGYVGRNWDELSSDQQAWFRHNIPQWSVSELESGRYGVHEDSLSVPWSIDLRTASANVLHNGKDGRLYL